MNTLNSFQSFPSVVGSMSQNSAILFFQKNIPVNEKGTMKGMINASHIPELISFLDNNHFSYTGTKQNFVNAYSAIGGHKTDHSNVMFPNDTGYVLTTGGVLNNPNNLGSPVVKPSPVIKPTTGTMPFTVLASLNSTTIPMLESSEVPPSKITTTSTLDTSDHPDIVNTSITNSSNTTTYIIIGVVLVGFMYLYKKNPKK